MRFAPNMDGPATGAPTIAIDWLGWVSLTGFAEDYKAPLELAIRAARPWELLAAGFAHPDPAYRLSFGLGAVSFVLGVISLVVATIA